MAYNDNNYGGESASGNMWSSGSRGGFQGGYPRQSNDDDDGNGPRSGGSYHGSYGNNNSRRGGGGYGFRRQNGGTMEVLKDAVFIQNLPKNVTRDEIHDAFSTVGPIKIDERSGGPKIWIYKDRDTGEGTGRATVTYENDETATRAISEYNEQHIDSINVVVRVQLAQRRNRTDNNDRGGRGSYRGGRSNWDSNNSRQGFSSGGARWGNPDGGFSGGRGGNSGGFHGSSSYQNRGGSSRGASHGNNGSSNYSPY